MCRCTAFPRPQARRIRQSSKLRPKKISRHLPAECDHAGASPELLQFSAQLSRRASENRCPARCLAGAGWLEPGQVDKRRLWRPIQSRLPGAIYEADCIPRIEPEPLANVRLIT